MKKKLIFKITIIFLFLIIFVGITLTYSYFLGSKNIVTREYTIVDSHIPDSFYGFKILQFSDLHYQSKDQQKLKKLVTKINELKPDLVIFTGDLIKKGTKLSYQEQQQLIKHLKKINSTIGSFAINGDEDSNQSEQILTKSNFTILKDQYEKIYFHGSEYFLLTGTSSITNKTKQGQQKLKETDDYLKNLEKSQAPAYQILLIHEPDLVNHLSLNDYNIVLAGHNHNGQIKYLEQLFLPTNGKKYWQDKQTVQNKVLYISGGLGNSQIPFRLFNQPSINLYRFKKIG